MSSHNLSHDGELRYIIQWFNEWSEFQREDFLPILADYLGKENSGTYVNGMVSSLAGATCIDKPMSLFQCRVKLFREWSSKWPAELKERLETKVLEIDPEFGEKLKSELSSSIPNGNGILEENTTEISSPIIPNEAIVA